VSGKVTEKPCQGLALSGVADIMRPIQGRALDKGRNLPPGPVTESQRLTLRCLEIGNNLLDAIGMKMVQDPADRVSSFAAVRRDLLHDKKPACLVFNRRTKQGAFRAPLKVTIGPDGSQAKVPSREDGSDCLRGNHAASQQARSSIRQDRDPYLPGEPTYPQFLCDRLSKIPLLIVRGQFER